VEIVVDDGPSIDNTETLVKSYIKKYWDKVKYYRNPVKIWMCPAFLEALGLWTGKYLWLMGSDDFMYKKSLHYLMDAIKKSPKLILSSRIETSFWNWEENLITDDWVKIISITTNNFFDLLWKKEILYYDKVNYFTFISIFCFEKKHYQESYDYLKSKIDNTFLNKHYFNFSLIGFSNLKKNDYISIIDNPKLIICESDNHWWSPHRKISRDLLHLTKFLKKQYILSISTKIFFIKMNGMWWFNCNIVPYIKKFLIKLWLFNIVLKLYKICFKKR
jgi:hypothetical protein